MACGRLSDASPCEAYAFEIVLRRLAVPEWRGDGLQRELLCDNAGGGAGD